MIKTFNCESCNYQTTIKCNYIKHLKTIKHYKNSKTNQNESLTNQNESLTNHFESLTNQNESLTNHFESLKTFTCSYCNYSSKYKQNYNRHFSKCSVRLKSDNKTVLIIEKLMKENEVLKKLMN